MDIQSLQHIMLFKGMSGEEIQECLHALSGRFRQYEKDAVILHAGDEAEYMGIVLSGSVTVESNDVWGNRTILSYVGKNGFFAETFAFLKETVLLVDVTANEDCGILFLSIGGLKNASEKAGWRIRFLSNLLVVSMHKNLALSARSFHTAPKTIRGKVLSYLNTVSLQKHASEFDIPFDRQQLADYLNVERTALSKELGKMRRDGILRFNRKHFILLV